MLWQTRDGGPAQGALPAQLSAYLATALGGDPDLIHKDGDVGGPMYNSTRQYRIAYRLYEQPTGDCR